MVVDFQMQKKAAELLGQLEEPYISAHLQTVENAGKGISRRAYLTYFSAMIWRREQQRERPISALPEMLREEINNELRMVKSEYSNLCLRGFAGLSAYVTAWQFSMFFFDNPLYVRNVVAVAICCMVLYPAITYAWWNKGEIHPFKAVKLILGTVMACGLGGAFWTAGLFLPKHPILNSQIVSAFNITNLLITANALVLSAFIAYYRHINHLSEVTGDYNKNLLSMSGIPEDNIRELSAALKKASAIPMKTHVKRQLKTVMIDRFQRGEEISRQWVEGFITDNCVKMNWIYWSGLVVQSILLLILGGKLIWAFENGIMTATDYFRQEITVGAVFGAVLIGVGVFCPINYAFRKYLYLEQPFSIKTACAIIVLSLGGVAVALFSGLVPSRFSWGDPLNPVPTSLSLVAVLLVVLVLQLMKSGFRQQRHMGHE